MSPTCIFSFCTKVTLSDWCVDWFLLDNNLCWYSLKPWLVSDISWMLGISLFVALAEELVSNFSRFRFYWWLDAESCALSFVMTFSFYRILKALLCQRLCWSFSLVSWDHWIQEWTETNEGSSLLEALYKALDEVSIFSKEVGMQTVLGGNCLMCCTAGR